jgi:hypothetical protein
MIPQELKRLVFETAVELARRGHGWSQESVVLREVADRLRQRQLAVELPLQQAVLSAWHNQFREGKLSWGYDLANPNWPFFHVPVEVTEARNAQQSGSISGPGQ